MTMVVMSHLRPFALLCLLLGGSLLAPDVQGQGPRLDQEVRGPFEATLLYDGAGAPVVWTETVNLPSWADWVRLEVEGAMVVDPTDTGDDINITFEVLLDGIRVDQTFRDIATVAARSVALDTRLPSAASEADLPTYDTTSLTDRTVTARWTADARFIAPDGEARIMLDELVVTYGETAAEGDLTPWFWVAGAVAFVVLAPVVAIILGRRVTMDQRQ